MNTRGEYNNRSVVKLNQQRLRGALASLLLLPVAAWAGGVVSSCTEASLRSAMAGGGTVTFACDGTITLASTLTMAASTVLDGSGHQVTISGGGAVQVLNVPAGSSLTMIHLTISNGRTSDGTNGVWVYPGSATPGGPGAPGGGIYNADTLTLLDCVVTGNRTGNGGLGYAGSFNSHLNSPGGAAGSGGGIYNAGTLTLSNCFVSGNSTGSGGTSGDGDASPSPPCGTGGSGAGIYNAGTLRLDNSTVNNNRAGSGASSPYRGPGADGGSGGGIWSSGSLIGNGCTFSGNSTGAGGAGGNTSSTAVGSGGSGGSGGAIWSSGNVTAVNCTFSGNSTAAGGAGGSAVGGYSGGGNGGSGGSGAAVWANGYLALTNCTVVGNSGGLGGSAGSGSPGGIGVPPTPNGSSGLAGAGGGVAAGGTAFLVNTIVALNTGSSPDVSGVFLSLGHNLIGATNGSSGFSAPGDQVGLNPQIGPLANNGGPTPTMPLLPGSPAIDAADTAAAPATDQRGAPRPVGPAADIGAYEYGWPAVLRISPSGANGPNILGSGNPGQPCRLLLSTDLSSWVPIATNQFGSDGTILFYDTCAPGGACRFYRLVMP